MYMNSVERVQEFARLPTEDQRLVPIGAEVSDQWPSKGDIEFIDVCLKYESNAEAIIKNASLSYKAGPKGVYHLFRYGQGGGGQQKIPLSTKKIMKTPSLSRV